MIIGTAGHIDHGKTTLVKALTGVDTDRLPEEKRRGITVELGFAPIDLDGVAASVIDVPGHEAFVKTMVAGAAGIDVALLVIAADEGIMPQTREHLAILELLEIPSLVVALTKSDAAEAEWISLVSEEVAALISTRWKGAPIVACSAVSGAGLVELRSALRRAAPESERGSAADLFRLPVDRCFTMKGTGTVVTGTVWTGSLSDDASVTILPAGRKARVRRLQRHGSDVTVIRPGERAAVALTGVDVEEIPRGSTLVTSDEWAATTAFDAAIAIIGDEAVRIGSRSRVRLHLAGAEVEASLALSESGSQGGSGTVARIKLDSPVAARGGDRFILRLPAPVGTIGGGIVLDPYPVRSAASRVARAFSRIDPRNPEARLSCLISLAGGEGVELASLPVRLGVSPPLLKQLIAGAACLASATHCYELQAVDAARDLILKVLEKAETTFPLELGVQLESVGDSIRCNEPLTRVAIGELQRMGRVAVTGSLLSRTGWKPFLDDRNRKTAESLAHAICSSGREPPSAVELTEKYGGEVPGLLRYLEREGRVVQVGRERYYAREAVDGLVGALRENMVSGVEYGPAQLRDVLGFSRKYLIPFLEYCDRAGVTERKGEIRTLRSVVNP